MPVHEVLPPSTLYRVGRVQSPLEPAPVAFTGNGRFDDPERAYRVLYAASERIGAFVETLAQFRPSLADLAELQHGSATESAKRVGTTPRVPDGYLTQSAVATLRVAPRQRWLDLRSPATHQALRVALAPDLVRLGYLTTFNWGDVLGHDYSLTQRIGRWAFESGYHGLAYVSAHDRNVTCWAIFAPARFVPIAPPQPIRLDDPDFVAAAALFSLLIPTAGGA